MLLVALRQPWFWIDYLQSHFSHQPLDPFAIDDHAVVIGKPFDELTASIKRHPGILLVQQSHQFKIYGSLERSLIVKAGSRETEELALPVNTELSVAWLNEKPKVAAASAQIFFSASPTPF